MRINSLPIPYKQQKYHDPNKLLPNKTYWYVLETIDNQGRKMRSSSSKQFRLKTTPRPQRVYIREIIPGLNTIEIIMEPGRQDIYRYELRRAIGSRGKYQQIALLKRHILKHVDTNLNPKRLYCYMVRAINKQGIFSRETPAQCIYPRDGTIPLSPLNTLVRNEQDGLRISWEYLENASIAYFNIYRRVYKRKKTSYKKIAQVKSSRFYYFDRDVKDKYTYDYYVTAINHNRIQSLPSKVSNITLDQKYLVMPVDHVRIYKLKNKKYIAYIEYPYFIKGVFVIQIASTQNNKIILTKRIKIKPNIYNTEFSWGSLTPGNYIMQITVYNYKNHASIQPSRYPTKLVVLVISL